MKRIMLLILTFALLCTPSFAIDCNDSNISDQQVYAITKNEFEILLQDDTAGSVQRLDRVQENYSNAIKCLTKYDDAVLISMGYSEETVALVQKFRTSENYAPTVAELTSAAPTMTFYVYDFIASTANNTTDVTFKWTFKWDSRPAQTKVDAVGAVWNHDHMYCSSASHEITFSDGTTYRTRDDLYDMGIHIDNDEKLIAMKFPMYSDNSSTIWCKSGKGQFSLHMNERVTSVQIAWGYGHQTYGRVESINITFGGGSLNFGSNYTTLCQDIRTYYVN